MSVSIKNSERLFGTSGVRGIVDTELTRPLLYDLGKSIATNLDAQDTVVVATDTRLSRLRVKTPLISGLNDCGIDVIDLGILPTPVLSWATVNMGAALGVMITASHNPPQYNGVKLFNADGIGYSRYQEIMIENLYSNKQFRSGRSGSYNVKTDARELYFRYITDMFGADLKNKFKIVVDPGNGANSQFASNLFLRLGLDVVPINDTPDGSFPGRSPEPREETLVDTYRFLTQINADLAICFDGDADRVVFMDKKGFIGFNESIAFIAGLLVKASGKMKVAATVETGMLIDQALAPLGVEVVRGKVGDVPVAELARDIDAAIGVEPVGVYIMPSDGFYPNSLLAALTLLNNISEAGEIRDYFRMIPRLFSRQRKFPCPNNFKSSVMRHVLENSSFFLEGKVNSLDGLRLESGNTWMLIRPSGTEPIIRMIVESPSETETTQLLDNASHVLEGLLREII